MLYETVDWRQIPHKYLLLLSPTLNKKRKRERVLQQTTTTSITSLLHSPKKKVLWRTMCKRKTENRPSITKMKQISIACAQLLYILSFLCFGLPLCSWIGGSIISLLIWYVMIYLLHIKMSLFSTSFAWNNNGITNETYLFTSNRSAV